MKTHNITSYLLWRSSENSNREADNLELNCRIMLLKSLPDKDASLLSSPWPSFAQWTPLCGPWCTRHTRHTLEAAALPLHGYWNRRCRTSSSTLPWRNIWTSDYDLMCRDFSMFLQRWALLSWSFLTNEKGTSTVEVGWSYTGSGHHLKTLVMIEYVWWHNCRHFETIMGVYISAFSVPQHDLFFRGSYFRHSSYV